MMSRPRVMPSPAFDFGRHSAQNRAINHANQDVDQIAAQHGYALPPASDNPSAQEARNRIAMLRRTVPHLSNDEQSRLDHDDLRLDDFTNPPLYTGVYDAYANTNGGMLWTDTNASSQWSSDAWNDQ